MDMRRKAMTDQQLVRNLENPLATLALLAHADDELSANSKKLMDEAILRIRWIADRLVASGAVLESGDGATFNSSVIGSRQSASQATSQSTSQAKQSIGFRESLAHAVGVEQTLMLTGRKGHEGESLSAGRGQTLSIQQIVDALETLLAKKRGELSSSKSIGFSWLRRPDCNLPVAVQINLNDFSLVVETLLDQAVTALACGEGVIRLGLHSGLRQIQLTIEDNGRGMNDDHLHRLRQKGLLQQTTVQGHLSFKQIQALLRFWGGRADRASRLGVGSRVCLEIPRVDAYAAPVSLDPADAFLEGRG